uniref:Uncharacterized protein n=1 Tax=Oryza barthii TaxID=65489 RepID=A0A0D3H4N2_9ORYZ
MQYCGRGQLAVTELSGYDGPGSSTTVMVAVPLAESSSSGAMERRGRRQWHALGAAVVVQNRRAWE